MWSDADATDEQRNCFQYIMDLRNKFKKFSEIARENAVSSQFKFTTYFVLKATDRLLEMGDETLVLLPDSSNKLRMSWKGPYTL